jgi:hypothetical protein
MVGFYVMIVSAFALLVLVTSDIESGYLLGAMLLVLPWQCTNRRDGGLSKRPQYILTGCVV